MNKEEILRELLEKVGSGEITKEEVLYYLELNNPNITFSEPSELENIKKVSHFSITKLLYILGAVIVTIGIVFFVAQIWEDIGSFGRILITFVLGIIFAIIGSGLFSKEENNLGQIFHFIGGMLIPGGSLVLIDELGFSTSTLWPFVFAFGLIFMAYLLLAAVHKKPILTFFALANGTTFMYLLVGALFDDLSYRMTGDIYAYLTMVIGISYLLLAHSFQDSWNDKLVKALHFFGSTAFLGAAFTRVFDSGFWQLLYFIIVFGGIYLSIKLRSQSILAISTIFLIAHVAYITGEYFADSLGWPITLIFLGFVFIGLGYFSVNINKRYIKNTEL
jgi:hypothetical protein